jgi:antitoxin VapB
MPATRVRDHPLGCNRAAEMEEVGIAAAGDLAGAGDDEVRRNVEHRGRLGQTQWDRHVLRDSVDHRLTSSNRSLYVSLLYIRIGGIMDRARVFWSGRSQAVRLPKEYRFTGEEVHIRRQGDAVILEPIATDWGWLDAIAGGMIEDFLPGGREQPPMPPDRVELDELFR